VSKTSFTVKTLKTLPAKDKRYNIFDAGTRGLGLAVYPSGQKTFFHLKKVQGWPRRTTLGVFPDMSIESARGKAENINSKLSDWKRADFEGPDPILRPKGVLTLERLLTDYCERGLAKSKRCKDPASAAKDAKWMFDKYLTSWRFHKLSQIRRSEVIDLHLRLKEDSGPYTANRVLQLLRALFNWAIHPDSELWSGVNPAAKIALFAEEERNRFLDGKELARLFTALKDKATSPDLRDYVNLALWTGARKSDVLSMRWNDVKLDDNRWDVHDSKSGDYVVPLTPEAVAILKKRRKQSTDDTPWVFPSFGKEGHIVDLKGAWARLLKRANISNLRQHDLRRTLGSWQATQGSSLLIIGKSLGHKSLDATEVYSQLDLAPVRSSMATATKAMLAAAKKKPNQSSTAEGNAQQFYRRK
jgi:integrase